MDGPDGLEQADEADRALAALYPRVLDVERQLLELRRENQHLEAERARLEHELDWLRPQAANVERELAALQATWVLRSLRGPRRVYARLRRRRPGASRSAD